MEKLLIAFTLMLSAIIVGCSTKEEPAPEPEQQPAAVVVEPEPEQQPEAVVVQPKLSDASDRPEWTLDVPEEDGYRFYVNVSGKWAEETDAIDDAIRRMRVEAVREMGTVIKDNTDLAKQRHGLSGSVQQFATLEKNFQRNFSANSTRMIRPKKFYHENVVDSAGTRGIRTHVLGRLNIKEANELAQRSAKENFNIAKKRMKEEQDKEMKKLWGKSTEMWKDLSNEEFFK